MSIISWAILLIEKVESPDIRDIKGPMMDGWDPFSLFIPGLLFMLLIGSLIFYILKAKKADRTLPLLPPHEIAREALKRLKEKDLSQKGLIEDHYSELSGIIRRYLESRFGQRSPEMTTEEFLLRMDNWEELPQAPKDRLKAFLVHCDLVKFAHYRPSSEEISWSLKVGQEIIDRTKEDAIP